MYIFVMTLLCLFFGLTGVTLGVLYSNRRIDELEKELDEKFDRSIQAAQDTLLDICVEEMAKVKSEMDNSFDEHVRWTYGAVTRAYRDIKYIQEVVGVKTPVHITGENAVNNLESDIHPHGPQA